MKKMLNTVYLLTPDTYLSLDSENLVIRMQDETERRLPLHNLEGVVAFGSRGASPALLGKCAEYGISVSFLSRSGKFLFRSVGGVSGNVFLRREQYRQADDMECSLKLARNFIVGKLFNSRYVLERALRDHALRLDQEKLSSRSEYLAESVRSALSAPDTDSLRGIEGEAAQVYFSVFNDLILQQNEEFEFTGRSRRPPLDRVNALLSFAYALSTSMCTSALECVGLDPYVGFMHTDRPGRCSLSLDLVEEFRAVMCDRFVLMLINKRIISPEHFENREDGAVLLNEEGRKLFFTQWQTRKKEQVTHPFLREKVEWGLLPYTQALLLARYLRGDIDEYPPLMWK